MELEIEIDKEYDESIHKCMVIGKIVREARSKLLEMGYKDATNDTCVSLIQEYYRQVENVKRLIGKSNELDILVKKLIDETEV